jgi:transcriptional regulator with GAF, ATPase, and Fis domain
MDNSVQIAVRYEELFRISDSLRAYRDLRELFRALPMQLQPILEFDCMSVFLNLAPESGSCWFVRDAQDQSVLTLSRDVPIEQARLSWAYETQQAALIPASGRSLKSGCAVPLTAGTRRLGAIFFGSENPAPPSEEEIRFLSLVGNRVALTVDRILCHERGRDQHASAAIHTENLALREELSSVSMFEEIVGSSEALDRVITQAAKVAPTDATVMISGESGTGKELIARAIHKQSYRSSQTFVRVNCAAIPPSLIASELFGHEKGAFTGALQRHVGRFELANGGTIFLDEIGDIPEETQIALLRVLQEREIERVGGSRPIQIDVRILAATNRDLRAAVHAGWFRLDLFYRLNVFPIQMPSLRERPEDILLLAMYFVHRYANKTGKKIKSIERTTLEWLRAYDWPGNIRELQNVVERAVILCDGEVLSIDETWLNAHPQPRCTISIALSTNLLNQERGIIESALEESQGRISGPAGAAAKLGIPRTTLESKIKTLRINKHIFKPVFA